MIPFDLETEKKKVLDIVFQSDSKLTPQKYIKKIKSQFEASGFVLKKKIC